MASDLILITGFPGFIGSRLVKALADDRPKAKFMCLVEPRMVEVAQAAAEEIDPKRVLVVTGDIGERGLGLSDGDHDRAIEEMTQVFHLAAIYNLAVPLEIAQRVNVEGTGNVIELCARAKRLERHDYVSTAYVAGVRQGVVYEHELVLGQGFKNHYESTKFQAEAWVREYTDRIPTTILRPAIVVGDSQTGETQKFDGPYFLLRAIAQSAQAHRSMPQFGRSDAPFNAVPVDFVVEAIAAAASAPSAVGQTLHLVDPEPLSSGELVDVLSIEYTGKPTKGRIPARMAESSMRVKVLRDRLGGTPRESIAYLNHPVRFDTRRAVEILSEQGVSAPNFREYSAAMVKFFRENEDDPSFVPG